MSCWVIYYHPPVCADCVALHFKKPRIQKISKGCQESRLYGRLVKLPALDLQRDVYKVLSGVVGVNSGHQRTTNTYIYN